MTPINPRKLLNSKWTAVKVVNKEKHFVITAIEFDESGAVIDCTLEAILSNREQSLNWHQLKDSNQWLQGWK